MTFDLHTRVLGILRGNPRLSADDRIALTQQICEAAEISYQKILDDRVKAHQAIYEAQLHAWDLVETSGSARLMRDERTPEQEALTVLYSRIHDAVKLLAGRTDIEHTDLTKVTQLANELKIELAKSRAESTDVARTLVETAREYEHVKAERDALQRQYLEQTNGMLAHERRLRAESEDREHALRTKIEHPDIDAATAMVRDLFRYPCLDTRTSVGGDIIECGKCEPCTRDWRPEAEVIVRAALAEEPS